MDVFLLRKRRQTDQPAAPQINRFLRKITRRDKAGLYWSVDAKHYKNPSCRRIS